jgi:hypothetical protein
MSHDRIARRVGERASFYVWAAVMLAAAVWRPQRRGAQPARPARDLPAQPADIAVVSPSLRNGAAVTGTAA